MEPPTQPVEASDAGTVVVSSTSPALSSLHASGSGGTATTVAEIHPLDDTELSSAPPPTLSHDDTTNTQSPNTINLTAASSMVSPPPNTHPREPRSAASTPSLSFREGYANHNNTGNTTVIACANQPPPSPMARPPSVQPSEHLPHLHILAERRPRPTESIVSSMSHSSRARVRPLSVTIDLGSVDPPAYEPSLSTQEPLSDQRSLQNQHRSVSPSLISMTMVQEHSYRPPSALSANLSAVESTQAVPPAGTEPLSAIVSPSMSAPRRPFLEEDELPEYITLSENGPPFKIPASDSITYTVTPSQGPEEFQQQQDEIVIHQPASRRRIATGSTQEHTSLSFSGDHDQGDQQGTTLHTRRGAWTLEYWVNDTIMYLCYLMDPKHSTTTALVPRRLIPDPNATQPRGEPDGQITTAAAAAAAPVNQDRVAGDMFNAFLAPEETTTEEVGTSNEEQETMERVPTGHLRGRPPPLTRPRARQSYFSFVPDISRAVEATYRGGSTAQAPVVIARPRRVQAELDVVSTSTPMGSVAVQVEVEPDLTTEATQTMGTQVEVVAPEEPSGDAPQEPEVNSEAVLDQIPVIDHSVAEDTPLPHQNPHQHLPLPPIRPLHADQAANDIAPPAEHNLFNNALTAEFFKNPTYALVSAEDPQTWIWWSTHHEHNLQRSRQEGPHEEVLMWWRTRTDNNTKETRERRKRLRQRQKWQEREVALARQRRQEMRRARQERLGASEEGSRRARGSRRGQQSQIQIGHQGTTTTSTQVSSTSTHRKSDKGKKNKGKSKGTLLQRLFAYIESKYPTAPHNETMEITMRVRGLYYAWREDDCGALPPTSSSTTSGYGTHSDVHRLHRRHHRHRRQDSHQYYQEDLQDTGLSSDEPLPSSSTQPPSLLPLSPNAIPRPNPFHHHGTRPRMFTLVRDDSLVMGQRVKGGPVAEIWIGDDDPSVALHEYFASTSATYPPMLSEAAPSTHHHGIEGVLPSSASTPGGPGSTTMPYYAYPSAGGGGGGGGGGGVTSDGASSITSNNGNTFMTEVSVATGGPMRSSTIASTFMAPVPSGRSFASSARYNVSMGSPAPPSMASLSSDGEEEDEDDEDDDERGDEEGDDDEEEELEGYHPPYLGPGGHTHGGAQGRARGRRAGSFSSASGMSSYSHGAAPPSSFPPSLLRRKCVIRILRGLNPEVETFALSTGPRLPELFELYTDQSMPGPSRGTFICSIVTFAVLFSAAFIGVAASKGQ